MATVTCDECGMTVLYERDDINAHAQMHYEIKMTVLERYNIQPADWATSFTAPPPMSSFMDFRDITWTHFRQSDDE